MVKAERRARVLISAARIASPATQPRTSAQQAAQPTAATVDVHCGAARVDCRARSALSALWSLTLFHQSFSCAAERRYSYRHIYF